MAAQEDQIREIQKPLSDAERQRDVLLDQSSTKDREVLECWVMVASGAQPQPKTTTVKQPSLSHHAVPRLLVFLHRRLLLHVLPR